MLLLVGGHFPMSASISAMSSTWWCMSDSLTTCSDTDLAPASQADGHVWVSVQRDLGGMMIGWPARRGGPSALARVVGFKVPSMAALPSIGLTLSPLFLCPLHWHM